MSNLLRCALIMGFLFNLNSGCSAQESPADRKPAVAGRFYPSGPTELRATLRQLFSEAKPPTTKGVRAVIAPHAGYIFSGKVAASAYNQVDPEQPYDNVFIIASSHRVVFPGGSIYNRGDYVTPLGKVEVNKEIAGLLMKAGPLISYNPEADNHEHSLEVQVPFLQYHLKPGFKLVPIVLGTQSPEQCRQIAELLKPYFTKKNLFVVSTDFSHYPPYEEATKVDAATCAAIVKNDPDALLKDLASSEKLNIPNLSTALCGWTSVLTLLYMTSGDRDITIRPVHYLNSGDSPHGDKNQVVGYWALALSGKGDASIEEVLFGFTAAEQKELLAIARESLEGYIQNGKLPAIDTTRLTPALKMQAGAFVTLKINGDLRGCIGRFSANQPLYQVIREMTVASSTQDNRFEPVTSGELKKIGIEISVLSPMKRISSPDEIVLGKHGVYMKRGYSTGTFLPQVATETGWDKEEFLGHCARDKAGIGWDGWKGAELYTYEAVVFGEGGISGHK